MLTQAAPVGLIIDTGVFPLSDLITSFEALFLKNRRYGRYPQAVHVWNVEHMKQLIGAQIGPIPHPNRRDNAPNTVPTLCGVRLVEDKDLREGQCCVYGPYHHLLDEVELLWEPSLDQSSTFPGDGHLTVRCRR